MEFEIDKLKLYTSLKLKSLKIILLLFKITCTIMKQTIIVNLEEIKE